MTKILVECPQCIASVRIGVLAPLRYLQQQGLCEVTYRDTKEITRKDIAWCDVLVCVRGCEYPTLRVMRAAKQVGRFLVYFLDDDLLHIPEGNVSTKYYSDYKIKENLTQILSMCNVLWAVNPRILDGYGHWCSRSALTKVPAVAVREPPQKERVFNIVFAGSVDHSAMVQQKLSPAVQRLLTEFSNQIHFTFIGADPKLAGHGGVTYCPFIDSYESYQRIMANGSYALGLAPAYHTPFYACKYYNKFVEYTSYGIAGLYEDAPPFTDIVRDCENGFFCSGDSEAWYQRLRKIIRNRDQVKEVAAAAQKQLAGDFSYQVVSSSLTAQIPELVQFYAPPAEAQKVRLPAMKWIFYRERIQLLFRVYGFFACFVIFFKILKRLRKKLEK